MVRDGKGGKDRVVTSPYGLITHLLRHLESVRNIHLKDLADGFGNVYLPFALERSIPMQTVSGAGITHCLPPDVVSIHDEA